MQPERILNVTTNPAWRPLTNADLPGYVVLAACAAVLVGLTLWTYLGSAQTTPRRLFTLIFLRLLALFVTLLTALRPAISVTEQPRLKSSLIVMLDASESMTVTDEYDKLSRYEVLRRVMEKSEPLLKRLEAEQDVALQLYFFSTDFNPRTDQYQPQNEEKKSVSIGDWIKARKPDGKRTDFGQMLAELMKVNSGKMDPIRGMIIISDGGNNVTSPDAFKQASRWQGIGCPIYPFIVGRTDTKTDQKDIGFTSIAAVPSPVAVKADLTIKAQLKATGLENSRVKIRLSVSKRNSSTQTWDDIPDLERTEDFFLRKATGNEIEIVTKAPEKPGQIRVTLEIKEGPAEDRIPGNNKIQTFVPVTKEGVRILVIDRLRQELKFLRYAIATDKRFDFVELIRQTDDPPAAGESRKFDVFNEAYDVIILGDVSPARLSSIDPKLAENIAKLVTEKGVGLMMLGGLDSFGGTPGATQGDGWKNSPIAGLLPVLIADKTAQVDADVEIRPLPDAFNSYIMKLDPDSDKNKKIWEQLGESAATRLGGYTVLGTPKQGAKVYAMGRGRVKAVDELPLLVGQTIGNNARVLAFGGDQTWKWVNLGSEEGAADPELGTKLHARFWKQIVLWLAHQDEVAGSVYVNATPTRLAVNGKTIFDMGIKDKHGDDVPNPKMKYQVLKANETADEKLAKPAERGEKGKARGEFSPKEPGEYRVVAWGDAKDIDGSEVREAEAWFDVYPEVSGELLDPSAKDGFLLGLEYHSRGTSADVVRKADKLPAFLQEEFLDKPLKQTNVAPKKYPDWRRDGNNWFLPLVLVSFVVIIGLEWGLRRVWGMV